MTLRCLLVDDSPEFLRTASNLLEDEGINVVGVAETGDDAVRLATELRPDVILTDIDMAGENGFTIAGRLEKTVSSAVILTSAHSEEEFAEIIETSPAIGFISKATLSATEIERLCTKEHHGACARTAARRLS